MSEPFDGYNPILPNSEEEGKLEQDIFNLLHNGKDILSHESAELIRTLWKEFVFRESWLANLEKERKAKQTPEIVEWVRDYPTHGFTQKELRFLMVDCNTRLFFAAGNTYYIHDDGPLDPLHRDCSGFWVTQLEPGQTRPNLKRVLTPTQS